MFRQRTIALGIIAVIIMIIGAMLLSMAFEQQAVTTRREQREAALRLWEQHGPLQYQILVQADTCRYTAQVANGVGTIQGRIDPACTTLPATVDILFDFAKNDGLQEILCDTQGCPCLSRTTVIASYHSALGYPEQLDIEHQVRPRWLAGDFWSVMLRNIRVPACFETKRSTIRVLEIQ